MRDEKRVSLTTADTSALLRRLVVEHVRPQAWRLTGAVLLMAVVAASTAALAKLMEPVLDEVFTRRDPQMLWRVAAAVLVVFLVKGVATYGQSVQMTHVGQRIVADLQKRLFDHLIRADLAFFQANPTGVLMSRLTNDVSMLRGAVSNVLTGIGKDLLTLAFLVGVMFQQDWSLALVTFFVFPLAVLPILKIGRRIRKVATGTQVTMGHLNAQLDQVLQGARVVKAYGMEAHESSRVGATVERLFELACKAARIRSANHPIMESLGGVAIVVVIVYGGHQVITGANTTGGFFSFVTALLLAYEPMKRLASLNTNLQEGLAAARRVFDTLDLEPAIVDRPDARPLDAVRGAIRFEGVRFAYPDGRLALDGIDLEVPANGTAALVGASGAGKSTIMNLIPRFHDVTAGRITVDGIDVRDVTLESLRRQIALVSQEVSLFDEPIATNIAYGRPSASRQEIEAAARLAAADGFIRALPEGYDTIVGEHGTKLSGGQRQRIMIARAILRDAPILLLDEATSALDTESERLIQQAFKRLMKGRSTLVIAHRLSTVIDADIIYVIERGRVAEQGRHAQLLARGGAYARLYALQFADGGDASAGQRAAV
jgi:subfamily B ATP-binding cassette protein MsbA